MDKTNLASKQFFWRHAEQIIKYDIQLLNLQKNIVEISEAKKESRG